LEWHAVLCHISLHRTHIQPTNSTHKHHKQRGRIDINPAPLS
jgi:hypothetical protein